MKNSSKDYLAMVARFAILLALFTPIFIFVFSLNTKAADLDHIRKGQFWYVEGLGPNSKVLVLGINEGRVIVEKKDGTVTSYHPSELLDSREDDQSELSEAILWLKLANALANAGDASNRNNMIAHSGSLCVTVNRIDQHRCLFVGNDVDYYFSQKNDFDDIFFVYFAKPVPEGVSKIIYVQKSRTLGVEMRNGDYHFLGPRLDKRLEKQIRRRSEVYLVQTRQGEALDGISVPLEFW